MVQMAVIGIFNTDVDAYHCTRGLYGHHGLRESALEIDTGIKNKKSLAARGLEPDSVLRFSVGRSTN